MSPAKRRAPRTTNGRTKRNARDERIQTLDAEIDRLKRTAVTRGEFDEMVKSLRQLQENTDDIAKHTTNLATQLTRMSQIQAELDELKRALKAAKLL